MTEITIFVAVLAGIGSFFAPCILPMIPAFLAYISGVTISDLTRMDNTKMVSINKTNVILNTIFFVLGFSVVFSTIGVAINSLLSSSATDLISGFNQVGGIIIILFGLFMILSSKIQKLNFEKKIFPSHTGVSFPLSFIFGLAFAAGWTPCVGPILGSILTLATITPGMAFNLLFSYSIGIGIPFVIIGIFITRATSFVRKIRNYLKYYTVILGSFIIILGVLIFFNQLAIIASFPLLNELILGV